MEKYFYIFRSLNERFAQEISLNIPLILKYYLLVKFEIIVIVFLLYIVAKGIRSVNYDLYYKVKFRLVRKPRILIGAYKSYLAIDGFFVFIIYKVLRVIVGYDYEKDLAHYIFEDGILTKTKRLFIDLFKPTEISNLISLGLAICIYLDLSVNDLIFKYFSITSNASVFFISLWTHLPVIVLILGIFGGWRYTSFRGRFIRGAKNLNQKIIEDTLDIHRRLIKLMVLIIDKGARNVERIIECRNLLIENRIIQISPLIEDIEDGKIIWNDSFSHVNSNKPYKFDLDEIEEINALADLIKEAKEGNIIDELFWIRLYNRRMRGLKEYIFKHPEKLESYLKRELFTPHYINEMLKKNRDEIIYNSIKKNIPDENERQFVESDILKDIKDFECM